MRFLVSVIHVRMLAGYQPTAPTVQASTLIVSADDSPNAPARAYWPRVLGRSVSTLPADGGRRPLHFPTASAGRGGRHVDPEVAPRLRIVDVPCRDGEHEDAPMSQPAPTTPDPRLSGEPAPTGRTPLQNRVMPT